MDGSQFKKEIEVQQYGTSHPQHVTALPIEPFTFRLIFAVVYKHNSPCLTNALKQSLSAQSKVDTNLQNSMIIHKKHKK